MGRWWYDGDEIDVVGINEQTETIVLGECKWANEPVDESLLFALEQLTPEVRWRGTDQTIQYALFAKNRLSPELDAIADARTDLHLFAPGDILALLERTVGATIERKQVFFPYTTPQIRNIL